MSAWRDRFTRVNKEEYVKFLQEYPEPLTRSICHICEPPLESYEDRKLAKKWPRNMVAKQVLDEEEPEYFVLTRLIKPVE